jgi:zinc/manganese transport system permease protein
MEQPNAGGRWKARPILATVIRVLILVVPALVALAVTWAALAVAYWSPYPIGFWLTSIGFAGYVAAIGGTTLRERYRRPVTQAVVVTG